MTAEPTNPRDVAVLALRDREGNVSAHLESRLSRQSLSPADAALARELTLGTYRRRATLDAVLRAFLAQPDRRLPGALQEVLWVALYQMLLLDRVPAFAAVNEAVGQAARFRHRRQGGLVNGVLRSVARSVSGPITGPVPAARDVVPVGPETYRQLAQPAFASPESRPVEYVAAAYSLPEALVKRWHERLGSLEELRGLAAHCNTRAPLILRVNTDAASVEDVVAELAGAGVAARAHANGVSVVLAESCDVTRLGPFQRGLLQPQDPLATAVVLAADPRPGMSVLDFCAAPGTKTTHLAQRMANQGSIIALDVSEEKLSRIDANCRRMGVSIVTTKLAGNAGQLEPASFDLVLADVPCSNTGVLARRAEARWRFSEQALSSLVDDQKFLIRAAGGFVRPGGRLVYSTCSVEPEEGTHVGRWYQRTDPRMRLLREQQTPPAGAADPTRWNDGGYVAVFEAG